MKLRLSLGRLRNEGRLLELGAAQLALNPDEIRELLVSVVGLQPGVGTAVAPSSSGLRGARMTSTLSQRYGVTNQDSRADVLPQRLQRTRGTKNRWRVPAITGAAVAGAKDEVVLGARRAPPATRAAMDLGDATAYPRHRLALAGRSGQLFADDAIVRLHRQSKGIPQALNNAAVAALIAAAWDGREIVEDACAKKAVAELTRE